MHAALPFKGGYIPIGYYLYLVGNLERLGSPIDSANAKTGKASNKGRAR
jgi:hypothetical protein